MQASALKHNDAYVQTKHYAFQDFLNKEPGSAAGEVSHSLYMYRRTCEKKQPVILELGTRKGVSTTMFLQACRENGGSLYSVDIEDFSDTADDDNWTYIQSDSADIESIIARHPALKNGIDVLFIDSLHKRSHVEKELYGWSRYLKKDALIFFDDIDPNPYRKNHRKDSPYQEYDWQNIQDGVLDAFYNNESDCSLEIRFGSTGLAVMQKRTGFGVPLKQMAGPKRRVSNFFWRLKFKAMETKNKLQGKAF